MQKTPTFLTLLFSYSLESIWSHTCVCGCISPSPPYIWQRVYCSSTFNPLKQAASFLQLSEGVILSRERRGWENERQEVGAERVETEKVLWKCLNSEREEHTNRKAEGKNCSRQFSEANHKLEKHFQCLLSDADCVFSCKRQEDGLHTAHVAAGHALMLILLQWGESQGSRCRGKRKGRAQEQLEHNSHSCTSWTRASQEIWTTGYSAGDTSEPRAFTPAYTQRVSTSDLSHQE